jgi:hypothetical protein
LAAPLWWSQLDPVDGAGSEILAIVAQHAEKRTVGLNDLAVDIPDEDPDDVRVEQAPNLGLALAERALRALGLGQV